MKIVICGSIKFFEQMVEIQRRLEDLGHAVLMPVKFEGVDYWGENNQSRVEAKRKFGAISRHFDKIKKAEAILVVNLDKNEIKNYIGANTFLEIGFAYYLKKKIFLLNPIPEQGYIEDEIQTVEPTVLNGNLGGIK